MASGEPAMALALELYRKPARARALRRREVPHGMLGLIRIAAAAEDEVPALISDEDMAQQPVREAAIFFLQQLLMQADGDDFRQLGLKRSATLQDVKDHKRQLLKWLHPDRNKNTWEHVLFQRVTGAAERLEAAMRQGDVMPFPSERRRSRRRPPAAWKVAGARTRHAADWRPRVKKIAIAVIVFLAVVGTAQAVLSYSQGAQFTPSLAAIGVED